MRYLSDIEVKSLLENKWLQIIEAIESAFLDSTAEMIPKTYLNGFGGDFRAMPAALGDYVALKWISVFPSNWQKEKHTIHGTLALSDRRTGETLIVMDCRTLTAYRTAATSAIAAKYCAPKAEEFAFIGCGLQAKYHIEAYESIFSHMKMSVELYDKNEKAQKDLFDWISEENIARAWGRNKSVKQAVQHADVVTTLTPSTEGYLDILDLKSNCHINAVGADAVGKRELMPNVIDGAGLIVCDDEEQALHSGELQYNVWPNSSLELYSLTSVIKKYTRASKQISVFDSTGVAIEDVAIANFIYNELL